MKFFVTIIAIFDDGIVSQWRGSLLKISKLIPGLTIPFPVFPMGKK